MDTFCLVMKWDYEYDKEGTWFDHENGVERYVLKEAVSHPLPHISNKSVDILSVSKCGETVCVELYVDHHSFTVSSAGEPVPAHASYSYSVCGDSVFQSLSLLFSLEKRSGNDC